MNKAIQFYIILMIPFILSSFSSNAQCDRHGDGNKPKYYKAAVEAADEDEEYSSQSKKANYTRLQAIDVCELEALIIAMTNLNKKSQVSYMKNLKTFFGGNLNTILLNAGTYDLIFVNANKQPMTYNKLYKLLSKSQFPLDREMGKQIKNYMKGAGKQASGETRKGAVLGIVLASLGSMGESSKYQVEAMKRGAYMGAFFGKLTENEAKGAFTNWKAIKVELYNLPNPYAIK